MKPALDPWLTVPEAAAHLSYHPQTIRKLIRSRELTISRRGRRGHIRVRQSELDRWMRAGEMRRSARCG